MTGAGGTPPARAEGSPWRVLATTSIGVVAVFLSSSGLNIALPAITRGLSATSTEATWFLLSFMLVSTALILIFGRLADIVGRRPLYLAGLLVFTAGALACAVAPTAEVLIAARVLQGVGAAAIITNTTALLTDAFPPAKLARALGWNASVAAVAQIAGPAVGGAATALLGWSGVFWLCAPMGLAGLVASFLVIPRRPRGSGAREPFDVLGALLSATALSGVVVLLTPGLTASRPWTAWVVGSVVALTATAFVLLQARRAHPLVDLGLFRQRARSTTYAAVLLNATASYAVVVLASLHLQAAEGGDPLRAGLTVSSAAVGTVLAAAVVGSLVQRVTPRALATTGNALICAGLVGFALVLSPSRPHTVLLVATLFVVGVGIGLFMTPSTSALMLAVPLERRGIANGLRSALQYVGYLLSTAIALAVATAGLDAAARGAAYSGELDAVGPAELVAFVDGVRLAAFVLATLAALAVLVCLLMPRTFPSVAAGETGDEGDREPVAVSPRGCVRPASRVPEGPS